ncbi:MAG: TIGR01777 family protein [Bacteroidetes bacterium GWF2_33_16]|nr:MAG: TIGR01777 family protein [Bacteroidetes bacterium GWE2_32_14]OFY06692.1 MAG: TIGR01777 family protein [Bacteroidetes bacterium GWF2_33_16]
MEITIFGATGFIGKELVKYLLEKCYSISIITRNKERAIILFGQSVKVYNYNFDILVELVNQSDVIINLAGENISGGLWTKKRKQKILDSRVKTGKLITSLCEKAEKKPILVIQSSAIGFYGNNSKGICTEQNNKGDGFLATVCEKWENSTQSVINLGIKQVVIRTGIVLGNTGGILPKLVLPFQFFMGVILGNGKNYVSWIHIKDEIRAIEYIINSLTPTKIYNLSAPKPVTMEEIIRTISGMRKHLFILLIPTKIINFFLADMGKEMLLADQKVLPTSLSKKGFTFEFEDIKYALSDLIK